MVKLRFSKRFVHFILIGVWALSCVHQIIFGIPVWGIMGLILGSGCYLVYRVFK